MHKSFFLIVLSGTMALIFSTAPALADVGSNLPAADLDRIGRRIWRNECEGTVDGLTSWNTGENFASLGIGHFIWYPKGVEEPFEESFPKMRDWLKAEGVRMPEWLAKSGPCPWPDRQTFAREHNSGRQKELRQFLAATVREQTRFIIHRLDLASSRFHDAAGGLASRLDANLALLRRTAAGNFALIDYVNFKGDGLNPSERYQGEGWGLLQVLMDMNPPAGAGEAPAAFAAAAKRILTRRVHNSPPARGEARWLAGWKNRCDSYRTDG